MAVGVSHEPLKWVICDWLQSVSLQSCKSSKAIITLEICEELIHNYITMQQLAGLRHLTSAYIIINQYYTGALLLLYYIYIMTASFLIYSIYNNFNVDIEILV